MFHFGKPDILRDW